MEHQNYFIEICRFSAVALYTNYYLIINGIDKLSDQVFNALKASVGNLNESHDDVHKLVIFKRLEFMTAYLACFICSNFVPFIKSVYYHLARK